MPHPYDSHGHLTATVGGPVADHAPVMPVSRPGQGAVLVDMHTGQSVQRGPMSSGSAADADPNDIFATAQTRQGTPVGRSAIANDTLVTFKGVQTTVASLVDAGVLEATPTGGFRPSDARPQEAPKAPQIDQPHAEFLPGEAEAIAARLSAATTPSTQSGAISDYLRHGQLSRETIMRAADEMRCDPKEVAAQVSEIVTAFEDQAKDVLSEFGDTEDVLAWAQKNAPKEFQEAMRKHAEQRSVDGYRSVGQLFVQKYDSTPTGRHEILNAKLPKGMRASIHDNKVVLYHPSWPGELTWSEAIRQKRFTPVFGGAR